MEQGRSGRGWKMDDGGSRDKVTDVEGQRFHDEE
jgi:hypothetical protein